MDFRIPNPFFSYDNITIKNVSTEKTLGTTIDNKLTFKNHFENICKKANQKLNALARITKFTSPFQRKTLLNSFIKSQFSYCPLIWMFTSKGLNKKINRIHEKSLRLVLNDHQSTLDEMLDTLNEKTIHQQCIDRLLIKYRNFWMAIPLISEMTFWIWGRIFTTSKIFILLLLLCLEIIVCSPPPFIGQINYRKPCLLTGKIEAR